MNPGTEPAVGVNVFEGWRRIALALKVAWLIVVALVVAILPGPRIDNTTVWGYAILAAAAGWFALSVMQRLIGWVARGFAGIPRGRDRRM